MTTFKKIILISFFIIIFYPKISMGAGVYVSGPASVNAGKTFEITINTDTEGESINSANIVLNYDKNLISFAGYKSDGSMINVWLNSPIDKEGSIYMDGIIPGGISGVYNPKKNGLSPIPLVRLLFKANKVGEANFSFTKTQILKNDGKGSELSHYESGANVKINEAVSQSEGNEEEALDKNKPLPFEVTLINSSIFSDTPSMIIFQATDLDSGVKEYKINKGLEDWVSISSPYKISKGLFSYVVLVRAYDFYGNYQEASVYIPGIIPNFVIWIIIISLLLFCILFYRVIKYRG